MSLHNLTLTWYNEEKRDRINEQISNLVCTVGRTAAELMANANEYLAKQMNDQ